MSVLTFFFRKAGNGSSLKKNPERKEKSSIYVGYIVPLRVYSVTPYDTDDGDSFNKIDVIDSF